MLSSSWEVNRDPTVAGLDGTAAVGGRVGPLSEGPDVELFRLMRALADVVVVGAET
ncbi:MAG TPA: pyrimidine reductase family protein, partial [Propionibacterium sp.]|nr:pyrimidine reductase family protein [Propionibacterium sp.]